MLIKHILKSIGSSFARSLLIVVSIMISAMVIFLNFVTNSDIVSQYSAAQKEIYQEYDVLVNYKEPYFEPGALKYSDKDINDAIELTYYVIEDNNENAYYKLMGTDVEALKSTGLISAKDSIDDDSVIISSTAAEVNKIKVGDAIKFYTPAGEKKLTITTIAENKGLLQPDSSFPIIIMNEDILTDKIGTDASKISAVLLDAKDNVDISGLVQQIKADNKDFSATDLVSSDKMKSSLSMIRMILLLMLLIVILLNIYIITSNSKVILESRLYTLGTFRSIGATKGEVAGILVLENLIYGVIGGVLGIGIGVLVRNPLVSAFAGKTSGELAYDGTTVVYMIFTVLFAAVLQIACTLSQIIQQSRKTIRSILFDKVTSSMQVGKMKTVIGAILAVLSVVLHFINNTYNILYSGVAFVCVVASVILLMPLLLKLLSKVLSKFIGKIFGYPMELGCRNLGYSRSTCSNVILITVTLMIVLSIYMISTSLCNVLNGATDQFDCDIRVTGVTESVDKYDFLKDNDVIEKVEPGYYFSDLMKLNDISTSFVVAGLDKEYLGIYEDGGKQINELNENEALLDSYYAIRLGISKGDTITLKEDGFKKTELKLKVVGFVEASNFSTSRNVLVISRKDYLEKVTDVPAVLNISIKNASIEEAKESVRRDMAQYDVVIQTVDEYINYQLQTTSQIINMVWLILFLSILLAFVGIVNNTILGFMQRKREYAVLNSVAMSKLQLTSMMFGELLFSVLFGCIIAFLTTLWLNVILSDLLYSIGVCLDISIDGGRMMTVSASTFFSLLITVIVPIVNMKKMVLVNEIKCD